MSALTKTQEDRLAQVTEDNAAQLKEMKHKQHLAVEQAKAGWPDFLPTVRDTLNSFVEDPFLVLLKGAHVNHPTPTEQLFLEEDNAAAPLLQLALEQRRHHDLENAYATLKSALYCFTLSDSITRKWSKVAFAQGTHVRLGAHSAILRLAGKYFVYRKIFSYLTIDPQKEPVRRLPAIIMATMSEVQAERGNAGHAYTMAQTLGAYNCSHPQFLPLMIAALDTDEGWSGYNPLLERQEDRVPTRNAIVSISKDVEAMAGMFKGNRSLACLFTLPGMFLSSPSKYAMMVRTNEWSSQYIRPYCKNLCPLLVKTDKIH